MKIDAQFYGNNAQINMYENLKDEGNFDRLLFLISKSFSNVFVGTCKTSIALEIIIFLATKHFFKKPI